MKLRSAMIPVLLLAGGCLARDISRQIDQLQCGAGSESDSGTTGSGTTDCPEMPGESDTVADTMVQTSTDGPPDETDSEGMEASGGSSSGSTEGSSSTGAAAVCGNGVIEAPEECDDGNDVLTDGCGDCGRARQVFITSEDYQGSVFAGLAGADQRCRSLADAAGLANFAGFKAWLSDSTVSAGERMFNGRGPYVLVNGLVVADSWEALLAGDLQNPINVSELSETKEYQVWTGTTPEGNAAIGADFCADWSDLQLDNRAFWGRSENVSSEWTIVEGPVDQPGDCADERALYCFEQE